MARKQVLQPLEHDRVVVGEYDPDGHGVRHTIAR
jgi:hypothetical protein